MNQTLHSNPSDDCRRTDNRIPLGFDVLWDHSDHDGRIADGWDKAFEARGVNLSSGGLAMRVPFLPDVGERIACKITLPSPASTPKCIVAGTEVVWASSHGQRLGEVGLRFVDLPAEHESLLESMLRGRYRPPTPQAAMRNMEEQISVDLDGVSDAIVATIIESDERGVTVEQPLPFLRIGAPAQVRSNGDSPRAVYLSAVDLVVEGDTPKLLLDLSYDTASSDNIVEPTIHSAPSEAENYSTAPGIPAPDDSQQARIVQGTPVAASVSVPASLPQPGADSSPDDTIPDAAPESEIQEVQAAGPAVSGPQLRDPSGVHDLPSAEQLRADEEAFEASISALRQPNPFVEQALDRIKAWANVVVRLFGTYSASFRTRAMPVIVAKSKVVGAKSLETGQRLARTIPRLIPLRSRRRTSQFPEARPQRAKRGDNELPVKKRKWVGPAFLVVGLGLAIYALWPSGDAAPEVEEGSSNVELAAPEEIELSVADSFVEPLPEPTALPELPELPAALDSAQGLAESEDVPTEPTGSVEFGAASVKSARTYRLRMSRPIARLEGRAESNGFVVRIPGSLSLDRAGPISASHPLVRRSMILNHGDYAELTIQFGDKGIPAYRVRGVGSELELLIGTKS